MGVWVIEYLLHRFARLLIILIQTSQFKLHMRPIIRVSNLSKKYQIGSVRKHHDTLRDVLASAIRRSLSHLRLDNKHETGGTIWALKDVNFEVQPGEVIGIIGRNGAGKSTLLKILSRITEPSKGSIDLYGRVASLLEVGTGFHGELTGRDNIFLNGAMLGMKRCEIQRKFDEIVSFAETEKFIDTPVKHYSSGMYMRLAFGVAAHLESEILLIDEVLAVGDLKFQQKCMGKMGEVAREGRTVLFVSHNMSAIHQLCREAILISNGTIEAKGESSAIVQEYLSTAFASETGEFNFTSHSTLTPRQIPVFKHLRLYSRAGHLTTVYHPNDDLVAELLLESAHPIKEPIIALAIEDNLGRRITTVASSFQGQPLRDIEGSVRVRCVIPNLPLASGRYLISISLGNRDYGMVDILQNVAWFDVVWNNSYGTGIAYHSSYGPVLVPAEWHNSE